MIQGKIIGIGSTDSKVRATIYFKDAYRNKITAKFAGNNNYSSFNAEYTLKNPKNSKINKIFGFTTIKETEIIIPTIFIHIISYWVYKY